MANGSQASGRENRLLSSQKEVAFELTEQAKSKIEGLRSVLKEVLATNHALDSDSWESLKDKTTFRKASPRSPAMEKLPLEPRLLPPRLAEPSPEPGPLPPAPGPLRPEPQAGDPDLVPDLKWYHFLYPGRRQREMQKAAERLLSAKQAWERSRDAVREWERLSRERQEWKQLGRARREWDRLHRARQEWEEKKQQIEQEHEVAQTKHAVRLAAWQKQTKKFSDSQKAQNRVIDELREDYGKGGSAAIERYTDIVLQRSSYPKCLPKKEFQLSFISDVGVLAIDYRLPALSDIPTLKQVRYVAARDTFEDGHLRPNEINDLYDDLIYKICLRTVYVIWDADTIDAIKSIIFNGWVEFADPATGRKTRSCIMSMQAGREAFHDINLALVDPRACFKAFKGVGSSKLHSMVAVPPLLRISREDARFVESVEVVDRLKEGTNLAAIGWEDFEHLIREIFEKEFSTTGSEVKVTRTSRDGGVDAIAYDPDPFRGGKIIIQAKRYTNTVEVSAVRDLYGTVLNEGAIKGILVTTATFGPDAYEFAKGKPITLLDGGNLLHLLERHGHRAYVDLAEAKKLNTMPLSRSTAG